MKAHKFDAALAGALQRQQNSSSRFGVTVRVAAPLPEARITELAALGVPADVRRSIFVAHLDRNELAALSDIDGVVSISGTDAAATEFRAEVTGLPVSGWRPHG